MMTSGYGFLEKVLFFFINLFLARYLSVENFGEFVTALGYATFFSFFTDIGFNATFLRLINLDEKNSKEHFGTVLIVKAFSSISIFIIMIISLYWTGYNYNTILLTVILGLMRFGNHIIITVLTYYEARQQFYIPFITNSVYSISFFLSTILIILYKGNYLLFAYWRLIITIVIAASIILYSKKYFYLKFHLLRIKEFLVQSIPFGLHSIYSNILGNLNVVILPVIHGSIYTGLFNNANLFFTSLHFIPQSFQRIITPFLYRLALNQDNHKLEFVFNVFNKIFAILSFYIFLIIFIFSEQLINTIFGMKYTDSIPVLKIIAFAIPFIFNLAGFIIVALDKQMINAHISGVAVVTSVLMNLILIKLFKADGAAMATIITFATIYILSYLYIFIMRYVDYRDYIAVMIKVLTATAICYYVNVSYFNELPWFYSLVTTSLIFFILIVILLIRRQDIDMIREMLNI